MDNRRIPYGFENRTLPHFGKFDDTPAARGYVENCYINGLNPQEVFFHAMAGRIGLIDTAVKTSTTGYIQRRLIKGLEDLMVGYDMTVRNNKNKIIQFAYGDDNIDSIKVESQSMPLTTMSIQEIYAHYNLPADIFFKIAMHIYTKDALAQHKRSLQEINKKCLFYTKMMLRRKKQILHHVYKYKDMSNVNSPVAFQQLIANVIGQMNLNNSSGVDISFLEAFLLIEETFQTLTELRFSPPKQLFKTLYFFYLSPKELLFVKRFNRNALIILLQSIKTAYY